MIAGLVAYRLGRRFVRPIRAAEAVTGRIAAGDLDARVPVPRRPDAELAAMAASVNAMAARLVEAKTAEQHFLQSVSHELRTPLTSIRGFAEAIEDGATVNPVAAAGVIAAEAKRLERLVGDLLHLATIQARRFALQTQPVNLDASTVATAASFAPAASELGLTLVADSTATGEGGSSGWVLADPDRLAQVTTNLIENALRYATHEVRVTTAHAQRGAELWVADDGPGIPPKTRTGCSIVFSLAIPARSARRFGSGAGHRRRARRSHGWVSSSGIAYGLRRWDEDGGDPAPSTGGSDKRKRRGAWAQHRFGVHPDHPLEQRRIDPGRCTMYQVAP